MLSYHNPEAERILELPIYRCTQQQHWAEEKARFEKWIEPLETAFYVGGRTSKRVKIWEKYREDSYQRAVTLWDFNQIVGWIRFYAWPGNIRAYLFFARERITKIMRHKTFQTRRGNFIEMYVFPEQSNEEIGHLQEPGSFGRFVIRSTGFATGVADAGSGWIFRR